MSVAVAAREKPPSLTLTPRLRLHSYVGRII